MYGKQAHIVRVNVSLPVGASIEIFIDFLQKDVKKYRSLRERV